VRDTLRLGEAHRLRFVVNWDAWDSPANCRGQAEGKFVFAGRENQHARRARYPADATRARKMLQLDACPGERLHCILGTARTAPPASCIRVLPGFSQDVG
jgi:hypothetical protein